MKHTWSEIDRSDLGEGVVDLVCSVCNKRCYDCNDLNTNCDGKLTSKRGSPKIERKIVVNKRK